MPPCLKFKILKLFFGIEYQTYISVKQIRHNHVNKYFNMIVCIRISSLSLSFQTVICNCSRLTDIDIIWKLFSIKPKPIFKFCFFKTHPNGDFPLHMVIHNFENWDRVVDIKCAYSDYHLDSEISHQRAQPLPFHLVY